MQIAAAVLTDTEVSDSAALSVVEESVTLLNGQDDRGAGAACWGDGAEP